MSDRKVKGAVLAGYRKFILDTWGEETVEEYLSATLVERDIKESDWYDDALSSTTLKWIAETKGEEFLERSGRYTVMNLGELAHVVDYLDIKTILERGPESYKEAFSEGFFKVEFQESGATIWISGSAGEDPYACRTWLGVFAGMLEMTRTVGTVEEVDCERGGASACEFVMEWTTLTPDEKASRVK